MKTENKRLCIYSSLKQGPKRETQIPLSPWKAPYEGAFYFSIFFIFLQNPILRHLRVNTITIVP